MKRNQLKKSLKDKIKLKMITTKLGLIQKMRLEYKNIISNLPSKILNMNSIVFIDSIKNNNYIGNELIITNKENLSSARPSILLQVEDQTFIFDGKKFEGNFLKNESLIKELENVIRKHYNPSN